ncbi:hypothetical protein WK26_18195 [Burkholderia vietnamiensis]|nr:hypothetical protein WK26_18195 [Burkholderia vietnamiensis]
MTEKWHILSDFADVCESFREVRDAEYYRVRTPTGDSYACSRAAIERRSKHPSALRLAFKPLSLS